MKHVHLPAPARVFYDGLTAFADAFALYPKPQYQKQPSYGVALLSLTGPRESVRAIQSALILGKKVHALLPGDTLIEFFFEGSEYVNPGRRYGKSFSHGKGQSLHALLASRELAQGHVAYGRTRQEFEHSLRDKVAAHLPFPTHPLWHDWWVHTLGEQDHLTPLITSRGFYAVHLDRDAMHQQSEVLLAQLREALRNGTIPAPKAEYTKEAA